MKPIDSLKLQRLIDGELNQQQTQELLVEAEASPDQWREIAVGFVENQLFDLAFNQQDSDSTKANVVSQAPVKVTVRDEVAVANSSTAKSYGWVVLAASLFLATTIGYMVSQIQNHSLPDVSISKNTLLPTPDASGTATQSTTQPTEQPKLTLADYRPDFHVEIPEDQLQEFGSTGSSAPVPLYSVKNVGELEQFNEFGQQQNGQAVSPEKIEQLTSSGYRMKQEVRYVSGQLNDGRSFVVPIRTIRFVSGQ